MFDVVGFGALNLDKLFRVNRIAKAEEESFVVDYSETCGGSAANTMVGLARLGCHVGFIGKIGDDAEGRMLLDDFRKEGVDTNGIRIGKCQRSGKVMGFVDREGQRALYIDPGANDTIGRVEVDRSYLSKSRFLHLSSFVGEVSFLTQKEFVRKFHDKIRVTLDPGALYARRGMTPLKPIIERAFAMMPNVSELEMLTGDRNYRKGARTIIELGVEILAVKLGSKGCYVTDGKQEHVVKPFKVKVVDTTGAGDAFDAGFLYGLLAGKDLYDCGRIANFVASRCIMAMGARTSLPKLRHLKTLKIA